MNTRVTWINSDEDEQHEFDRYWEHRHSRLERRARQEDEDDGSEIVQFSFDDLDA